MLILGSSFSEPSLWL